MLDFSAPANLEYLDLSNNQISKIERVQHNPYLKSLNLNCNKIEKIEGVQFNKSLISLSLSNNKLTKIENLDDMWLEELNLSENHITKITGLTRLRCLQNLNLWFFSIDLPHLRIAMMAQAILLVIVSG